MTKGARVLVTRAAHQGSELADRLRERGMEPVLVPTIEIAPPSSLAPLDEALRNLPDFDWLIFTSANAVETFAALKSERKLQTTAKVAAIGAATARALQSAGFVVDLVPPTAIAEALAEALLPFTRQPGGVPTQFLLLRAEEGRDVIPDRLRSAGAWVTVAPVYRNVVRTESIDLLRRLLAPGETEIEAITFTSSSTARNFFSLCEAAALTPPPGVRLVSIGPVTSATLRELGYPPHAEAAEASVVALAEAVQTALSLDSNCGQQGGRP